jgi:RNA recognition motif-containing protein
VYGPNSQSRGIANITFGKPDGASKAFQKLNGLLVDNRPIKVRSRQSELSPFLALTSCRLRLLLALLRLTR